MDYPFDYSNEKDLILRETGGIGFEDVISAFNKKGVLANIQHFNQKKYPGQKILIVEIDGYAFAVPYVIDKKRKVIFLKTIWPDRRYTKKYLTKK